MTADELKARIAQLNDGEAGLVQRVTLLTQELEQRSRDLVATRAARDECKYWLDKLTPSIPIEEFGKSIGVEVEAWELGEGKPNSKAHA